MQILQSKFCEILKKVSIGLAKYEFLSKVTSFWLSQGKVMSYNDMISIIYPLPALDFECRVSQDLYKVIEKLPDRVLDISLIEGELRVVCEQIEIRLKAQVDDTSFYLSGDMEGLRWQELKNKDKFFEALKIALTTCSSDVSALEFSGLHIKGQFVESTDRFRITRCDFGEIFSDDEIMLPAGAVSELVKWENIVAYFVSSSWVYFKTVDNVIFGIRRLLLKFPDISPFLAVRGRKFKFPKELAEALDRAAVLVEERLSVDKVAQITVTKDKIIVKAENEKGRYVEVVPGSFSVTKDISFVGNPEFLAGACRSGVDYILTAEKLKVQGEFWEQVIAVQGE